MMKTEENQENSIPPKTDEKENDKTDENEIIDDQDIIKMLLESNIDSYEPQVVNHLTNYMNNYVVEILNCADAYKKHAGRDGINVADVKLAIETFNQKVPAKRLSFKELIQLAHEQNKEKLEDCSGLGLLVPKSDYTLSKSNYKLKSLYSESQPPIDITNRYNQMVSLNSIRNQGTIPTFIRTSVGTVSLNVPMNLAHQRIILKQPAFTAYNKMDENASKRFKLDGIRK